MVNRLIIENSGGMGSMVLADEGEVVLEGQFHGAAELATGMQAMIQSVEHLDEIVVGIGPGSYTGLRVAIATALGLKLSLGCRTFGCPSVLGYSEQDYVVIGDARRSTLFLADIRDGKMTELPRLVPRLEIADEVAKTGQHRIFVTTQIPELPNVRVLLPHARYLLNREPSYADLGEPIYLKEPHITRPP